MGTVNDEADVTVVDLHRLGAEGAVVSEVSGSAYVVLDRTRRGAPVVEGLPLRVGDTLELGPASRVTLFGGKVLLGGPRGRAHTFVSESAFRSTPSREDVPRLLERVGELEASLGPSQPNPFEVSGFGQTDNERAMAGEFARLNLVSEAARLLGESDARELRAVCLFLSGDTAFVAVDDLSIAKLRKLMTLLGRPVTPHNVSAEIIEELLDRVYAS
jgi:hypothetical protein